MDKKAAPAAADKPAESGEVTKSANQLKNEAKRLEKEAKYQEKLKKQAEAAAAKAKSGKPAKADKKEVDKPVLVAAMYTSKTAPGEKKGN